MEQKLPFTSYDFWAYLAAGFLLLFVVDYVIGTGLLARDSWTVVQGIVAVSTAYVAGHLIASASSMMFERFFVGKLLGSPRLVLFGETKAWRWIRSAMPGYFQSLPCETRKAVLDKGTAAGVAGPGEALFWVAYANSRATPVVMGRLDNFLNLYGFCRNIAFVALVDAVMLYWSYRWGNGRDVNLYFSWAAFVLGIGMVFRFLKFFRHYSVEVFTNYAYSREASIGCE